MEVNIKQYGADKLKELRGKSNMTQDDLALQLSKALNKNFTRQTISLYETGLRGMNQDILFALSDIFDVSINYFFPSKNKE